MKRARVRNPRWRHKRSKNLIHSYARQGTRAKGKTYDRPWHNLMRLDDDKTVELRP